MNTNQFESHVKSILSSLPTIKFYQNKAPTSASVPYVEFRFDTIIDNEPTYMINLVFACYDSQNKTSKGIKDIADLIQNTFNKVSLNFTDMSIHSTMSIRQEIPNEMLTEKQAIELQFDLILYQNKEVI